MAQHWNRLQNQARYRLLDRQCRHLIYPAGRQLQGAVKIEDFNGEDDKAKNEGLVIFDADDKKGSDEQYHSSKLTHTSTNITTQDIPVAVVSVQHQKQRHWLSDLFEEHDEQQTSISSLSSDRRTGSVRLQRKLRSTRSREIIIDVYSNVRRQLSEIIGQDAMNSKIDSKSFSSQEETVSNEYIKNRRVNEQSTKPREFHLEK